MTYNDIVNWAEEKFGEMVLVEENEYGELVISTGLRRDLDDPDPLLPLEEIEDRADFV